MSDSDMKAMLTSITGETDDGVLSTYLILAGNIVRQKAFPYGDGTEEVPSKYQTIQVEIAAYLLNKRGAEGEISHNENGLTRTYENGDIPSTLLQRITPLAGVL